MLCTTAIFLITAIISYNPADPSLSNSTSAAATNLLGIWGSYASDAIMQSFGYSFNCVIAYLFFLGVFKIRDRRSHYGLLRLSIVLLLLPLVALGHTFLDKPLQQGSFGGFVGLFINSEFSHLLPKKICLIVTIISTIIAYFIACGFNLRQWMCAIRFMVRIIKVVVAIVAWSIKSVYILLRRTIPRGRQEIDEDDRLELPKVPNPVIEVAAKVRSERKKSPIQSSFHFDIDESILPPTTLLKDVPLILRKNYISESALNQNSKLLQQVLQDFGVNGKIVKISPGPVVTLYELEPSAGTKSSRVIGLADDISRSMSAVSARIAVIPGKNALGIELPNAHRETVYLRELMETDLYKNHDGQLPLILGKNISGDPVIADLAKMPHLLVAGTTGSGKSVAINTMILSLLYKHSPKQCQLIMIDPKMLELSVYEGIPHLLAPVVTEAKKAVTALKWVVKEMENRYRAMSSLGVRNIQGYNKAIEEAKKRGDKLHKEVQTGFNSQTGKPIFESIELPNNPLPYIVVIVDEMADLMIVSGKEIESSIQRIAQMARAAGIHVIMATQRPSVDVITGVIKANFPTRISFQVTSKIDSRTILGEQGAEQLLGMGDMLHMVGGGRIERVHGPFVGDKEVEEVVNFLKLNGGDPIYKEDITSDDEDDSGSWSSTGDDLYDQAVSIVLRDRRPTTSYIQRCLKIGYNKAATLIEQMEKNGVVSAPNGMGKREVLIEEN